MSSVFDGLEEIKRKVKQAEQIASEVAGAVSQMNKDRKSKFGFSSLKKAKRVLPKFKNRERKRITEYVEFYKKWTKENLPKLNKLIEYWKRRKK